MCQSLGVRGRRRAGPAVAIVQGDARPGSRLAVAHARDPHHALFHTDPRVHREICDLHDRGWPARGPWLSVRGVGPRARNTDRGQRRVAGPGRVIGRHADPGHHRPVGVALHRYRARRGAGGELRPQFFEVPPV